MKLLKKINVLVNAKLDEMLDQQEEQQTVSTKRSKPPQQHELQQALIELELMKRKLAKDVERKAQQVSVDTTADSTRKARSVTSPSTEIVTKSELALNLERKLAELEATLVTLRDEATLRSEMAHETLNQPPHNIEEPSESTLPKANDLDAPIHPKLQSRINRLSGK